jgi:hypothetical protein
MSLIFLQGTTIIGNIFCIIKIIIRITNSNSNIANYNNNNSNITSNNTNFIGNNGLEISTSQENNKNLQNHLPLFKSEGLNISINLFTLSITIVSGIFVTKLFVYHSNILFKNLTTYQDIKMSINASANKINPFFIFTRIENRMNFLTNFKHFIFLFRKKILFKFKKPYFIPYEYYNNDYKLEKNENFDFIQTNMIGTNYDLVVNVKEKNNYNNNKNDNYNNNNNNNKYNTNKINNSNSKKSYNDYNNITNYNKNKIKLENNLSLNSNSNANELYDIRMNSNLRNKMLCVTNKKKNVTIDKNRIQNRIQNRNRKKYNSNKFNVNFPSNKIKVLLLNKFNFKYPKSFPNSNNNTLNHINIKQIKNEKYRNNNSNSDSNINSEFKGITLYLENIDKIKIFEKYNITQIFPRDKESIINLYQSHNYSKSQSKTQSPNKNQYFYHYNNKNQSQSNSLSQNEQYENHYKNEYQNNYQHKYRNQNAHIGKKNLNRNEEYFTNINDNENDNNKYDFNEYDKDNKKINYNIYSGNKRMNKYLMNNNIINKGNFNRGYSSSNNQPITISSYFSSNLNENNNIMGEIHLSEREKNNFNHIIRNLNLNKDQINKILMENKKIYPPQYLQEKQINYNNSNYNNNNLYTPISNKETPYKDKSYSKNINNISYNDEKNNEISRKIKVKSITDLNQGLFIKTSGDNIPEEFIKLDKNDKNNFYDNYISNKNNKHLYNNYDSENDNYDRQLNENDNYNDYENDYDYIPDTNRKLISRDIDDKVYDYNFITNLNLKQKEVIDEYNIQYYNDNDSVNDNYDNKYEDDSKRNLSKKIISIINSSGTQNEKNDSSGTETGK